MERRGNRSETSTNDRAPRQKRHRTRVAFAAAALGALGGVALLTMLTPLASATAVAGFSAPYTNGKLVQVRDRVAQGCGESAVVTVPASFSLSTGTALGQVATKASPCSTADSQASYDATLGVKSLGFTASAAATVTVTANWTATWNVSSSMSTAAANAGAQSTVEIYLILKVTDTTTGKTTKAPTLFLVQKDLLTGSSFHAGALGITYFAKISKYSLVAGHSYNIYAAIAFSAQSVVPQGAPAGSVATANVDMGSAGHGGVLNSISVG